MNKELEEVIKQYVEEVGAEQASEASIHEIKGLLKMIIRGGAETETMITGCKLKFAVIEYLYFHDDTEKEAIKLLKKYYK